MDRARTSITSVLAGSVEGIDGRGLITRGAELLQVVLDLRRILAAKGLLVGRVFEFAATGQ